jgi:hypothetical protein
MLNWFCWQRCVPLCVWQLDLLWIASVTCQTSFIGAVSQWEHLSFIHSLFHSFIRLSLSLYCNSSIDSIAFLLCIGQLNLLWISSEACQMPVIGAISKWEHLSFIHSLFHVFIQFSLSWYCNGSIGRGAFQLCVGPLDAQCRLLDDIVEFGVERGPAVDVSIALSLIESTSILVHRHILSQERATCRSGLETSVSARSATNHSLCCHRPSWVLTASSLLVLEVITQEADCFGQSSLVSSDWLGCWRK